MIDKTIPNRLQNDADQRFIQPNVGEMLDAQNVTISESGASTSGVIKNMLGTVAATSTDRVADDLDLRIVGSVSDPQRGYVYWFVADAVGNAQHAIYRHNTADNTYDLVIRDSRLNFPVDGFVKADVVNAEFQQDGVIQTALYFTDNVNPPRKINVDRMIAGDYGTLYGEQFDLALSSIKPASNTFPTFIFSTDLTSDSNGLSENVFQFATQILYTDGEESAISPYSELAKSKSLYYSMIQDTDYSVARNTDNVCEVSLNISNQIPDVRMVRLLARNGNLGPFFIVDEFDPTEDLSRNDGSLTLYDSTSGVYYFRNDTLGPIVSDNTVNKLYDNVPFLAVGQSVSGNRLMYSNYTEGRPNTDPEVELTVQYDSPGVTAESGYIASANIPTAISESTSGSNIGVDIDLVSLFGQSSYSGAYLVPAGSKLRVSFVYKPTFNLQAGSGNIIEVPVLTDPQTESPLESVSIDLDTINSGYPDQTLSMIISLDYASNLNEVRSKLIQSLEDKKLEIEYDISGQSLTTQGGTPVTVTSGVVRVVYVFDEGITTPSSGQFSLHPKVEGIFVEGNLNLGPGYVYNQFSGFGDDASILTNATQQPGPDSGYLSSKAAVLANLGGTSSFKAGSYHDLGVVYYDRFNRSGNVNKLGSFYVDWFGPRTNGSEGPARVEVNWLNYQPPTWADRWQIVYSGAQSYESYVQYTTGVGFAKLVANDNTQYDEDDQQIYVKLDTLNTYLEERNATRNYSFTKGDKLRVISYDSNTEDNTNETIVYPTANNGGIVEFNVVGVVELDTAEGTNLLRKQGDPHNAGDEIYGGVWLILEHPSISSGVVNDRYDGFDWYSITNTTYPDGTTASSNTNFWGKKCVVELMTPRKTSTEDVFFEIGIGGRCGVRKDVTITNNHGPNVTLNNGDAHYRPVPCKTAHKKGGQTYQTSLANSATWQYETIALESMGASDRITVDSWDRGRPQAYFERSATIRRRNGITYSDAYAEDVENLSLSSFNPSLANFFSLDSANGACNYIGTFRDDFLVAFQENRVARIPIEKNIITSATDQGLVGLSTKVLNTPKYYLGDFGCGNNPESVLIKDGNAFFVDTSRRKVVRLTTEGLSPISEVGVDSMVKDAIDAYDGNRIVSGYDPGEGMYFVTFSNRGTYAGLTLGYNVAGKVWQSRYTFFPDMYSDQNDTLYSALYVDPEETTTDSIIFHSHTDEVNRNTFYGTGPDVNTSTLRVVSNHNPSMVKVFNAISLEGDSNAWVADPIVTDLNSEGQSLGFVEKEGAYYSFITRDENGTKHITGVGTVASVTGNTMTFANRVNRNPIPYGATLRIVDATNDEYDTAGALATDVTFVSFADAYTINVAGNINILFEGWDGAEVVAISEATINGDPIRGHWAEITLTNNQAAAFELYCVNTHFADSKQNHALRQAVAKK